MSAEGSQRRLPKNADYRDVLPLAVDAKSARRTFFPVNGTTFTSDGNNIIRIDVSADAFLDPKHSYLKFRFNNLSGTNLGFDFGGGHGFIRRMRIEQSGSILSDCNSYAKLMSAIILPVQGDANSVAHRSITEGQRYANEAANGNSMLGNLNADTTGADMNTSTNPDTLVVGATTWDFCIPLMNGLLGTTQSKLVPLQLLGSAPLTIELEISPLLDIGVFAAQPAAGTNYSLTDIRYVAQLVEVSPEISSQMRYIQELSGGKLVLNGTDYTHFNGNIAAGATGQVSINVPARRKSIKSLFFVGASQTYVAPQRQDQIYNLSYGGNFNMGSYQMKIGSVVVPPTPIDCNFTLAGVGPHATRSETLMELKKCLTSVASTHGVGSLTTSNYMVANCDVANMVGPSNAGNPTISHEFGAFGIDLESFQGTAIESGTNTASRATPITLLLTIPVANVESVNVDCYIAYDSMYYIDESGTIRVSI